VRHRDSDVQQLYLLLRRSALSLGQQPICLRCPPYVSLSVAAATLLASTDVLLCSVSAIVLGLLLLLLLLLPAPILAARGYPSWKQATRVSILQGRYLVCCSIANKGFYCSNAACLSTDTSVRQRERLAVCCS
jgi:hypothetical protein